MHRNQIFSLLCIIWKHTYAWLQPRTLNQRPSVNCRLSDDWSSFQAVDEDDEDEIVFGRKLDRTVYATENDDEELKATVGASLSAPTVERDATPIFLPAGTLAAVNLRRNSLVWPIF